MTLLDLIIVVLFLAWLGGWGFGFGGSLIHLLIFVVIIAVVYRVLTGRNIG